MAMLCCWYLKGLGLEIDFGGTAGMACKAPRRTSSCALLYAYLLQENRAQSGGLWNDQSRDGRCPGRSWYGGRSSECRTVLLDAK